LREAGVPVQIEFYENAFHGIAGLVDRKLGYEKARQMQRDLIQYLQANL
jgi:hypothetical protein